MSQGVLDVDELFWVLDVGDESISIAFDIEDGEVIHSFSFGVDLLDLNEILPVGLIGGVIPVIERFTGVRMVFAELSQPSSTDNVHGMVMITDTPLV